MPLFYFCFVQLKGKTREFKKNLDSQIHQMFLFLSQSYLNFLGPWSCSLWRTWLTTYATRSFTSSKFGDKTRTFLSSGSVLISNHLGSWERGPLMGRKTYQSIVFFGTIVSGGMKLILGGGAEKLKGWEPSLLCT